MKIPIALKVINNFDQALGGKDCADGSQEKPDGLMGAMWPRDFCQYDLF